MIIDAHAHLFHPSWYPSSILQTLAENFNRRRRASGRKRCSSIDETRLERIGSAGIQIIQQDVGMVADNIIENNIFWNDGSFTFEGTTYAITGNLFNSVALWPEGTIGGNIIRHNIFPTGQTLMLLIRATASGGNIPYGLALAEATFADWANNLQVDPLLVDAPSRDFTLQAGSPAIDWGRIIGGHPFLGVAPDVGVWERN